MKSKVLSILKPKVASLGFNDEELMSVAEQVATAVKNDAKEEEINAQIDAVIPYLQLAQRQASRVISKTKPKQETKPEKEDVANDDLKNLIAEVGLLKNELFAVKQNAVRSSRRAEIEGLVKDRGIFGKQIISSFDRMSFDSDETFASFVEETKNTLKELDTQLASAGLSNITAIGGKPKEQIKSEEVISDEEVESLAKTF